MEIIDRSTNNLVEYCSSKIQATINGVCSYCGVTKINSCDRLIYQKIAIKISEHHNLIINICEECCLSLNSEPCEQINIMVFAPLIISRFWKEEIGNPRLGKFKEGIRGLLMYHEANEGKKLSKNSRSKSELLKIKDKIAMNN